VDLRSKISRIDLIKENFILIILMIIMTQIRLFHPMLQLVISVKVFLIVCGNPVWRIYLISSLMLNKIMIIGMNTVTLILMTILMAI